MAAAAQYGLDLFEGIIWDAAGKESVARLWFAYDRGRDAGYALPVTLWDPPLERAACICCCYHFVRSCGHSGKREPSACSLFGSRERSPARFLGVPFAGVVLLCGDAVDVVRLWKSDFHL